MFVLDLLALRSHPDLVNDALSPMLTAPHVLKMGCGLSADLKKVAAVFPLLPAFAVVQGCVDLGSLWHEWQAGNEAVARKKGLPVSLSALSQAVLGKPLDKSMQTSNWENRPLTCSQLRCVQLKSSWMQDMVWLCQ